MVSCTVLSVKRGAYGGGASYDGNACSFRFFSYRDPRLAETLKILKECAMVVKYRAATSSA